MLCPLHLSGLAHMRWLCGRSRRRQHSFDRMIQGLKLFHMTPITWLLCLATLYLSVCVCVCIWEDFTGTTRGLWWQEPGLVTHQSICVSLSVSARPPRRERDWCKATMKLSQVYRLSHSERDITFSSRLTWWKAICCDFSLYFGIFSICCKWQHIWKYVI